MPGKTLRKRNAKDGQLEVKLAYSTVASQGKGPGEGAGSICYTMAVSPITPSLPVALTEGNHFLVVVWGDLYSLHPVSLKNFTDTSCSRMCPKVLGFQNTKSRHLQIMWDNGHTVNCLYKWTKAKGGNIGVFDISKLSPNLKTLSLTTNSTNSYFITTRTTEHIIIRKLMNTSTIKYEQLQSNQK